MRLDNRILMILLLIVVYFYGSKILMWEFDYSMLIAIFFYGILTQILFCLAFKIPINALISTIITTLLLGLLIRTEFIFICGMLSFFAISSKYIFQFRGKHLFNPTNFGLVFMMLFTQQAFITTHRVDTALLFILIIGSLVTLYRSNASRIDVFFFYFFFYFSISHLLSWFGNAVHNIYWNELWFFIYSLILIADPLSNPNSRLGRLLWVMFIVVVSFVLGSLLKVPYSHFYALALGSLITPIADLFFKKESKFSWDSVYRRILHTNDPSYMGK